MSKKDPEIARMDAERNRAEIERLLVEIRQNTASVPPRVIAGSYQVAVDFKKIASRGQSLIHSKRPTLKAVRECASELARFW